MRDTGHWRCVLPIVAGLFVGLAGPALAQERIGAAAAISNRVEGTVGGTASTLAVGSAVFLNELVRTGDDGVARLVFLDDTNLHVGPRSQVTLDRFVYNPGRSAGSVVVRASQGAFRFVTGSQRPQNYLIQTPIASIGVRGTVFDLYVQADRIVVTLRAGVIRVTAPQGRVITLSAPDSSVTVYAGGNFVRHADWSGIAQPNYAALFGPVQVTERTYAPPVRHVVVRGPVEPPFAPGFRPGRVSFGLTIGGVFIGDLPVEASSGFFSSNLNSPSAAFLTGVQGFVDVARFGNSPAPFASSILSVGAIIDFAGGASIAWKGTCSGIVCEGTGKLDELNLLAAAKLTTPLSPTDSLHGYLAAGAAILWPTGTPIESGPEFIGHDIAPAVRLGVGFDRRISDMWSMGMTGGVQVTGATEYATTIANERFRINDKVEGFFAITWTYTSP